VLDEAAGVPFQPLQVDGSDEDAQRWILDNQDVKSAFQSITSGGTSTTLTAATPVPPPGT
jgi:hypothetical protein